MIDMVGYMDRKIVSRITFLRKMNALSTLDRSLDNYLLDKVCRSTEIHNATQINLKLIDIIEICFSRIHRVFRLN